MKNLIELGVIWMMALMPAGAEERYGFLNIVNLVPSRHALDIHLAGKELVPSGLKPSVETGWFMIPAGLAEMKVKHPEYHRLRTGITITEGASQIIMIALEPMGFDPTNGIPAACRLRTVPLPAYASGGHAFKAVSMIRNAGQFQFAGKQVELEYLKPKAMTDWTGRGFEINHQGKKIGAVSQSRERASHYLLLGTDYRGKFLVRMVNADIQTLPAWSGNQGADSD